VKSELEELVARLKALRKSLKNETASTVSKLVIRDEARALGGLWHTDFLPQLAGSLSDESKDRFNRFFTRLIKLSSPNNKVSSYLETLDEIIKPFNAELTIPSQKGAFVFATSTAFDQLFQTLTHAEENDYLKEALACAKAGHRRAAVVLGWSAGIDRIHRAIELIGFSHFNVASAQMASQQAGRFKKFTKAQNVNSLGEIREVFDSTIIWVIEGMGLIDSNQHTRLRSCFEMRCHCAHPGDAPITDYNLLSFFSDIDQIVLSNPKFKV
jgi:hypothetical protein